MIRRIAVAWATLALAVSLLLALDAVGQSGHRSVRDGVYSETQAERGRRLFRSICTECHEIEEFTGPGAYLEEMNGEPLWEMFEFVWLEMPEDNPSWLEPAEYAEILSYILSVYGVPAGGADLPVEEETLRQIIIESPSSAGS